MASCGPQNFTNVTPQVWNCLVAKAASFGVTINTPSGTASQSGFTFTWNWTQSSGTLTIECTDSPFIVPCSTINSEINSAVTGCGGTAG